MTELERALVALGSELEFPATPDVWPRVAGRLEGRRWLRPAMFALAAVAALGIAFAVPSARSAILRLLHIGNATVEQVETLPRAQHRSLVFGLGKRRPEPTLRLPYGLSATGYYEQPGLAAALLRVDGRPVLYAQLQGDQMGLAKKLVGGRSKLEEVQLGEFGVWIEGADHVLLWQFKDGRVRIARTRLAGNVLLWLQGGVTHRLEGDLSKTRMLALARQITR